MKQRQNRGVPEDSEAPVIPHAEPASGAGSLEAALPDRLGPVKRLYKLLGPGFITGASDDGPSGIGTYATAGASLGYATLWTALVTFPLMAAVQFICARIGMVSGMGLAGILKHHYSRWVLYPVVFSLVLANTVNILATAATLFRAGKHDIQSATEAAQALRPLAGNAASVLLALGLTGAGFLAVPILTGSAAYALSEAFSWQYGLDKQPRRAKQFYAIIVAATLIEMLLNFLGINPIAALFWTAVINGPLAPPLLVLLMVIANIRQIMGDQVNGVGLNIGGWATTIVMSVAAIALFSTWGKS